MLLLRLTDLTSCPCFSFFFFAPRRCGGCREYAARSRSRARADGGGWPFGGDAGALPPVEVRRFRWWEDEAKAAAEDEEGEVERRMAAKRRKRSVAELFAAVPRVARGQRCGKGKAAKGKLSGKEHGKSKLVLPVPVRVKASNGSKKKKKKVPATGTDATRKVAHCIDLALHFLDYVLSGTIESLDVGNACRLSSLSPGLVRSKWMWILFLN